MGANRESQKEEEMTYKNEEDRIANYKKYYQKHKEHIKEYSKKRYKNNRKEILERNKQWQKNNPEKFRESKRKWIKNNFEKVKKSKEKWEKNNPNRRKKWQENNPDYARKNHIKKTYNLFYEDWLRIWESQDGKCAICGTLFVKPSNAYIDHNHKINEIRGLLCMKCNFGIGNFNDNPILMRKAIIYLLKRKKK